MTKMDRRTFVLGCAPAIMMAQSAATAKSAAALPDISIRPFESKDARWIEALVGAQYDTPDDRLNGTFYSISGLILPPEPRPGHLLLVAEAEGELVGVGAAVPTATIHPVGRMHIVVAEAFRRRGIGSRLYKPLHASLTAAKLLPLSGLKASEEAGHAFAGSVGMKVLMRERHYLIDAQSWPVGRWCANALARPTDYSFVTGDTIAPDLLWQTLWGAYYESHRSFVPTLVRPRELERNMKAAIDPRQVVVAMENGVPAGAAALLSVRKGMPIALYPCSASKPMQSIERERALVAHLMADRLVGARKAGHAELMINAEDLDGRLMPVMADVPVRSIYEYYTLTAGRDTYWPRPTA